jgi:hypothetical protein
MEYKLYYSSFYFAVLSLGISTLFELLTIILYAIYFSKLSIVKYYRSKAALEGAKTISDGPIATDIFQNVETNQKVIYCNFNLC